MTTWLFDLGNTRLKFAALGADGRPGEIIGATHAGGRFDPHWLDGLPQRFDAALVASVASPALRVALLEALAMRCRRISLAGTRRSLAGVTIAYAEPSRLGVDRFLALLAAHARLPGTPVLLAGVGTALTIDLLDGDGLHRGGRIAPSPTLMREVLHQRAPHLPAVGGVYAEFASDTDDALVSGCDGAALGLIDRSLTAAASLLGAVPALLLHGGGAAPLLPHLPAATLCSDLVLAGLSRWHGATVGAG